MHRFILYTDELDVAGIIQSSSRFHHAGDAAAVPPISSRTWLGSDWIHAIIRNYAQAYPTLRKNDPRYPTPQYLDSVVKVGNIGDVDEMTKDTEGSNWIKKILLDRDPRPVYISVWGGTNTVAAALRSIRDEYYGTPQWATIYKKVSNKAWILIDLDQDITYKQYVAPTWPDVNVVMNNDQYRAFAYNWTTDVPAQLKPYYQAQFQDTMLRKGPILSDYSLAGTRGPDPHDWFSEGDTPQFMQQFPFGLSDLDNYQPSFGNWGGRYIQEGPHLWVDNPPYLGLSGAPAADYTPYSGANDFAPTTLAASAGASDTKLRLASVSNLSVGDVVTIGTGQNAERRGITRVGSAQGAATSLTATAVEGDTNVKVDSTRGFSVGDPMTIGQETHTVTTVGTPSTSTTLTRPANAGSTNVKLGDTANLSVGDILWVDGEPVNITKVGNPSLDTTIALASTTLAAGSTTLSGATSEGGRDLSITNVTGFLKGQTVMIGSGSSQELATLDTVGVGGSTTLGSPSAAGTNNVKILSTANFVAGTRVWIDSGLNLETATISPTGPRYPAQGADQEGTRAAGATTAAAPTDIGAATIKANSITGFLVGAPVTIDAGANAESAHLSFVGTAGAAGTGLSLTTPLKKPHAAGVQISAAGLTFTRNLAQPHAVGAMVTANGVTLSGKLKLPHADSAGIATVTPAGTKNLKVASIAGFAAGKTIMIGSGDEAENAVIASVGTAGLGGSEITLTAPTTVAHVGPVAVAQIPAQSRSTNLKLASVAGIAAGDSLTIDTGANAEKITVVAVGTPGRDGTGVTVKPALSRNHFGTVAIQDDGTGVTFGPALNANHAPGASATDTGTGVNFKPALAQSQAVGTAAHGLGSGITLTSPLAMPHPAGDIFQSNMNRYYPQARWTAAIQNDFAARADWQLKGYADANHAPVVTLPPGRADINARAGQRVQLVGNAIDPDDNSLTFSWWQYREAGTYRGAPLNISTEKSGDRQTTTASFVVPRDAKRGDTIHVILEVTDSGTPPLTRYQRVIITVA